MLHKKTQKEVDRATLESIKKEMAKPRVVRSARIAELRLDHPARIPERASTTMSGTVDKIIPSPRPNQPELANIVVTGADKWHRDLRIQNKLIDEYGEDVSLKKGACVKITLRSKTTNNHLR